MIGTQLAINLRTRKEMPKTENLDTLEAPDVVDFDQLDLEGAFDSLMTPDDDDTGDNLELNLESDKKDDEKKDEEDDDQVKDEKDLDGANDTDENAEPTDSKSDDGTLEDNESDDGDLSKDKDSDGEGEELTLVSELVEKLGLETEEEFDDSIDGLVNLVKEGSNQLAESQLNQLFDGMPDVRQFMQFRLQGGTAESFFETMYPTEDYATLTVSEDDTGLQERLVRKALQARGMEKEDADETIDEFKTSGILHSQANKALKGLDKFQKHEKEQLIEQQQLTADEEAKNQAAYLKEVQDTINSNSSFRGVVVGEKEKDSFSSYVSDPVKDGQSQFQIDMQEAPTEVYLAIAALMRKGFDFEGLISRKASSIRASNLRDRIKNERTKLRSQRDDKKDRVVSAHVDEIDLSL